MTQIASPEQQRPQIPVTPIRRLSGGDPQETRGTKLTSPSKRAVLFLRSNQHGLGSRQAASWFRELQRIAGRLTAARLDAAIVREYHDRKGLRSVGRRDEFLRMLGDLLLDKDIDYVITHDWSRLVDVNNLEEVRVVTQMAEDTGVEIVTVMGSLDESPAASLLEPLMAAFRDEVQTWAGQRSAV